MYSPKIDEQIIHDLYVLSKRLSCSMTSLVNSLLKSALADFVVERGEHGITLRMKPHLLPRKDEQL